MIHEHYDLFYSIMCVIAVLGVTTRIVIHAVIFRKVHGTGTESIRHYIQSKAKEREMKINKERTVQEGK